MNYCAIKKTDIADGPGVRVTLFVSGCRHHCKGCFNEMTWDFSYGVPYTKEVEDELVESAEPATSISRILPMEQSRNSFPLESWSASPHAHITEFEGSWAERRMDKNRRGTWRIRS